MIIYISHSAYIIQKVIETLLHFKYQVMKFGNLDQIDLIAAEVGGTFAAASADAQIELFDILIDGCRQAIEIGSLDAKVSLSFLLHIFLFFKYMRSKPTGISEFPLFIYFLWWYFYCILQGPLLDFFGVPVKANDIHNRVQELQLLAKRISRYEDPIKQFRVLTYLKPSNWSKGCGWNQSMCFDLHAP